MRHLLTQIWRFGVNTYRIKNANGQCNVWIEKGEDVARAGEDMFVNDFVAAWDKVMNLDRFDLA